jgi:MoxR-like ATPase
VVSRDEVLSLAELSAEVHISPEMMDYIVRLVQSTRAHAAVYLGASPRASLALMRCSKVRALIHGRTMVLPDDLRVLVKPILNHRIILTPEAELDQITVASVVEGCLASVPYTEEV